MSYRWSYHLCGTRVDQVPVNSMKTTRREEWRSASGVLIAFCPTCGRMMQPEDVFKPDPALQHKVLQRAIATWQRERRAQINQLEKVIQNLGGETPRIRVKIGGKYREAFLIGRGSTTVDIRLCPHEVNVDRPSELFAIPVSQVRKADQHLCVQLANERMQRIRQELAVEEAKQERINPADYQQADLFSIVEV